jgi:hypothetical protein
MVLSKRCQNPGPQFTAFPAARREIGDPGLKKVHPNNAICNPLEIPAAWPDPGDSPESCQRSRQPVKPSSGRATRLAAGRERYRLAPARSESPVCSGPRGLFRRRPGWGQLLSTSVRWEVPPPAWRAAVAGFCSSNQLRPVSTRQTWSARPSRRPAPSFFSDSNSCRPWRNRLAALRKPPCRGSSKSCHRWPRA